MAAVREGNFNFKLGSENRLALDLFRGRLLFYLRPQCVHVEPVVFRTRIDGAVTNDEGDDW